MRPYLGINLSLFALVALVLGVALFLEQRRERAADRENSAAQQAAGKVSRILVEPRGGPRILLARDSDDGTWRMQTPLQGPADPVRIAHILELLHDPEDQRITAAGEPAVYGLDQPGLVIELDGERIEFGDSNPLDGRRYLRRGRELFLSEDRLVARLEVGRPELILVGQEPVPDGFRLKSLRTERFQLVREAGRWRFTEGAESAAGSARKLAAAWLHARAVTMSHWEQAEARHQADPEPAAGTRQSSPAAIAPIAAGEVLLEAEDGRLLRYLRLTEPGLPVILGDPGTGLRFHLDTKSGAAMFGDESPSASDS